MFFQIRSNLIQSALSVVHYPLEEYAPFGLDKRRCIAADFVVALSAMFVEILLEGFEVTLASDGPPKFGAYHWEPNPDFSIAVSRIEERTDRDNVARN